jgi:phage-related minor tail protein
MADRIKGITVEIGGDTTGLSTALREVNTRTRDLQKELKDVEKLLKFDPNNVELLAQRQQLLTQSIEETTTKLNQLKEAEQQVQRQFERGEIGEEQYRAFRREIQATEQSLQGYEQALQDMQGELERVGQGTRQLTTLFEATESSVEDYANVIGQRLVRAIQNGTATSRDLEYAFQRIGRETLGANGDIERLRTTLQSVDDGNPIGNVRRDLQQMASEAGEAKGAVSELSGELAGMVGGLAAGGGIAGVIEQALDTSSLNTKIDITFDVPEESKDVVKAAIKGIQTYGLDAEDVLEGVRRQWALNKDATDQANDTVVRAAGAISAAYSQIDFTELIQETNEVAAGLGISNEEAIALYDSLLKSGFPPEQLDIIAEYGTQMKNAGYEAKEIQAIFEAGIDTNTWNIDNLNDGVKEARIRMAAFGEDLPDAVTDLLDGTGVDSKKFMDWGKAVAEGGETGSKAMGEMVTWLDGIEDKSRKNAIATQVFGTMWEDQGQNMISVFEGVSTAVDKTTENTNGLYKTMGTLNADPAVEMQQAFNNMKTALQPVLTTIAEMVSKVATWVAENPKLAATITAVVTAIGILLGIIMVLVPIFQAMSAAAVGLGIGLAPMIGIVAAVVVAIGLLIAAGIAIYKNWDTIKAKAIEIWGAIKEWFIETFTVIKEGLISAWDSVKTFTAETWESIKQTTSTVWTAIKDFFINIWNSITSGVMAILQPFINGFMNIFNGMKDGLMQIFTGIQQYFTGVWELIKNIFLGAILLIVDLVTGDFEGLKEDTKAIFENIKEALKTIWDGIKNIFQGAVSAIWGYVKAAWENLKTTTSTVFNAIKNVLISIWEGIKTFFRNTVENIKTAVINGFENMKTSVSEKMNSVKTKITEIWNNIVSFFKGISLKQIGKDIIQGLFDGISSMARTVWNKAKEIADGIKNTIRKALDIHSPSRVMMELGEFTGEGMAKGLQNSLGTITGMAKKMATAVIPAIENPVPSMNALNGVSIPQQPMVIEIPIYLDSDVIGRGTSNVIDAVQNSQFQTKLIMNGVR